MKLPAPVKAFLQKPHLAVLTTVSPSGQPQATPVWYLLEDNHILVNTSEGRKKLRNLRANPRVTVTILDADDPYRYVQMQGKVTRVAPHDGARDIDRLSMRYRGQKYRYPPTDGPDRRVSILIRPIHIDARGMKES